MDGRRPTAGSMASSHVTYTAMAPARLLCAQSKEAVERDKWWNTRKNRCVVLSHRGRSSELEDDRSRPTLRPRRMGGIQKAGVRLRIASSVDNRPRVTAINYGAHFTSGPQN
ncbi:hypothetical protein OUZ56_002908 [Daphnia magna]|uniref:Uncharacterized protein n=1 Tax=Daphnia magna TaxID=35525 RepID=A0ABR0A750_9CRUS|nr:hypothetical protein OUZ56_002908 [Daphnia magna]